MKAKDLRNSILQLAIQGKLVEQDANDEPASVLLERIKAEKAQLILAKKIRKQKALLPIADDEIPFDIPDSWEWARLLNVSSDIYTGNSISKVIKETKYTSVFGLPYIATKDLGFNGKSNYINGINIPLDEPKFKVAPLNSILCCIEGGSAGRKIGILEEKVCFGNKLACTIPLLVSEKYLLYYFKSSVFNNFFTDEISGIIGGVGINAFRELIIPIPPLEEQQRIVDKIENILPLIDEYDEIEVKLDKIEKELPEKLKKSILQYAVEGKLVEQNSDDEPANILLNMIKNDTTQTIKKTKIRKQKKSVCITEIDKFHDIPKSWEWCRLIDLLLASPRNGYSPKRSEFTTKTKVLMLTATTKGKLDLSYFKYVNENYNKNSYLWLKYGDILIQRSNSEKYVGTTCLYDSKDEGYTFPDLMMKIQVVNKINHRYIVAVLQSPFVKQYFESKSSGTSDTMKKITQGIVSNVMVPLPPLAEQQRIVDKIDELMSYVDILADEKKMKEHKPVGDIGKIIELVTSEQREEQEVLVAARAKGTPLSDVEKARGDFAELWGEE